MVDKSSYTAASAFPEKLLHSNPIERGKIKPIHVQILPTNKCNLDCKFCSYSDREKTKEIKLEKLLNILNICYEYGTKAITISGGGEPMMYYGINELIDYASQLGIKVGLVSNGILLNKLKYHDNLTWCRISSSDDRLPAYKQIEYALEMNPRTDFAFSHVITRKPNYEVIRGLIEFANKNKFTHIRLVSDLLDLDNVPNLDIVKNHLKRTGIDDKLVIYQGRKDSIIGSKDCYISLLKPVIAPEGIFPCCGSIYSIVGQERKNVDEMKMGELEDLEEILKGQRKFNGSICNTCYYSQYNEFLKRLLNKLSHIDFV